MAIAIIPRCIRGRLYFRTADVLVPTFVHAAIAWADAGAQLVDMPQPVEQQTRPPLRRCDDCELDLSRDVLRALGACPRWGRESLPGIRRQARLYGAWRRAMNVTNEIAKALATALSLRATARACSAAQGPLKSRLTRAAEALNGMVLLAVRGLDRIGELERQLAAGTAASDEAVERAELSGPLAMSPRSPAATMAEVPIAPVIVGGVDVAQLSIAARIVEVVETASVGDWHADRSALIVSPRMARTIVQETFQDLRAACARGAS